MKLKKRLAPILALVTVFSAAFTSLAEVPAGGNVVEAAEISYEKAVISDTPVSMEVSEVEEVIERDSEETGELSAAETGINLLGAGETINWWTIENDDTCTLHISTGSAPATAAASGTYIQLPKTQNHFGGLEVTGTVTKVSIDTEIAPSIVNSMFHDFSALTEIVNLDNLDISNVDSMSSMFYGCAALTSLDLSGFNTERITSVNSMFSGCSSLETIYASESFDVSGAASSTSMFNGCQSLVGGAGTVYDSSKTDAEYAHIDGGTNNPGYFTRAKTIADILPADFPDSADNAWVNGNGGKAYAGIASIDFVGPKWTFCPYKTESLSVTENGYLFENQYGQILFNMNGDELQSITVKDYTSDDSVNGTYMEHLEMTVLEMTKAPDKTVYTEGEKFDPAGMELSVTFNNGLTRPVSFESDDVEITPDGALKVTDKYIMVNVTAYGETLTLMKGITVNLPLAVLTGIEITKAPSKTVYTEGESFDPAGMTVTALYSNGKTKEVTDYQITPAGALKTTDTEVDISYTEGSSFTVKQSISVKAAKKPDPKPVPTPAHDDDDNEPLFTGTWNNPVKTGSWTQDAHGIWHYGSYRNFMDTWGYILNPFAKEGQNTADWFWFDARGNMLTGWQFINGKWYYLNPSKDGTLGACQLGGITPDGWTVDESGAWIESVPRK